MLHSMAKINIKNHPYYFFNVMINIKKFDSSLLEIKKLTLIIIIRNIRTKSST